VHSPRQKGFLYSHLGWIFARRHAEVDLLKVSDLARYPELMWLHKYELVPPVALGVLCYLAAGWPGLVVGFVWSTVLVYHATFCINSLAHVRGSKRYVTGDDSRNNWLLALFTMGEGWHNNHHAYQSSVRQGFWWWEIDVTFYILKLLSWIGVVWDLKSPPDAVRCNAHRLGSRMIQRAAAQLANSFDPELIAATITAAINGPSLFVLQQKLAEAQHRAADLLATYQLPHVPTRPELVARAKAMFAETPSLEDIVGLAQKLILDRISTRLSAAVQAA
jgi:stearoyl-CoA desaturase (delta-9 desaturase)